MRVFFIGLQFLTRISVCKQENWTEEDFGRSVRYFPLVGVVLGVIYSVVAYIMFQLLPDFQVFVPQHVGTVILLLMPILLTGGIHCDGFMDTVDGLFSGRPRDRMLEIMKDSRTGSFGVVAFVALMLMNWGILLDMPVKCLASALFIMPVIGRLMMTTAITNYPYARPEGMGKAFAAYARPSILLAVWVYSVLIVLATGVQSMVALAAAYIFTVLFSRYAVRLLGGLTGDVYGAICTLAELVVLLAYLISEYIIDRGMSLCL